MEITKQGQEESAASSSSNTWHKVESLISVEGTNMAINSWVYLAFWGMIQSPPKLIITLIGSGIVALHELIFQK